MKFILVCGLCLLFVGATAGSSEFSTKVKTEIADAMLHSDVVVVIVGDYVDGELFLSERKFPELIVAILSPEILLNVRLSETDPYIYRSQAWINANNLHKTGLFSTFKASDISGRQRLC